MKIEIMSDGDTGEYQACIALGTKNEKTALKKLNILKFKIAQMSKRPKRLKK